MNQPRQKRTGFIVRRHTEVNRAGMASLEFVLGLPFLLFVFAMIYSASWASVNRTVAIQNARYDVWKMRDATSKHQLKPFTRNDNSKPFSIPIPTKTLRNALPGEVNQNNTVQRDNLQGEISGKRSQTFGMYSWLGGDRTAKAEAGIIYWTWDHEEVNSLNGPQPHAFQVIAQMTGLISNDNGASGITGIFSGPSN